jgi:hypothetical protein
MKNIYVLLFGSEWEDLIIFLSKDDAIKESLNYKNSRIEVFSKNNKSGYTPTYNYYENGEFIETS